MKQVIGQQGEVRIIKIDALPANMKTKPAEKTAKGFIVSHSESGHHHLLTGGEVIERTDNVPIGMQIFYGILNGPAEFIQDAGNAHGGFNLGAGVFEFRVSREHDPFTEQARRVAD